MFRLSTMDVGLTPPIEHLPVKSGETVVLGEALSLSGGALTKCGATTKPDYIAVGPGKDGEAPVIKVQDYMVFETALAVAPGEGVTLAGGTSVTIHTDGAQVTATTASGVAKIMEISGNTVGDTVTVRF